MRSLPATLMAVCALTGCASSTLKVQVDLYQEDPRIIVPMRLNEALELARDVERLRAAAQEKTAERESLATKGVRAYLNTWHEVARDRNDTKSAELQLLLDAYIASAREAESNLGKKLDAASTAVNTYIADYQREYDKAKEAFDSCEASRMNPAVAPPADDRTGDCLPPDDGPVMKRQGQEWIWERMPSSMHASETNTRKAVDAAVTAYRGFSSPVRDSFTIDWAGLRATLATGVESAQRAGLERELNVLLRTTQAMNGRLLTLAQETKGVSRQAIADVRAMNPARPSTGMFDATMTLASQLESARASPPDSETARAALTNLVQNGELLTSMMDRTQDRGDAVLRRIARPENADKWQLDHTDTYFYAQGKSNVVIVRDAADKYTIHDASNDPIALVKGQLAVSRAVANAAMTIASAASGVKVPRKAAAEGGGAGETSSEDVEAFAVRKANAEEASRAREQAIRMMQLDLSSILATLASSADNPAVLASQKSRFEAVLMAYRKSLEATGK